jgi:hypothetical protein
MKPASPFQSGGMPDQSWWDPATDGIPLTQGDRIRKQVATRKRKFWRLKRGSKKAEIRRKRPEAAGQLQIHGDLRAARNPAELAIPQVDRLHVGTSGELLNPFDDLLFVEKQLVADHAV